MAEADSFKFNFGRAVDESAQGRVVRDPVAVKADDRRTCKAGLGV